MRKQAGEPTLLAVARTLLLDREASSILDHLDKAGVPAILLKGAAIAMWLYDDGAPRPYLDIDILVRPSHLNMALAVLTQLGYSRVVEGAHPAEVGPKEIELVGPTNITIDLHHGLLGASASSEDAWEVLFDRTTCMRLGTGNVRVLDVPARAMHLALHAAQNGPIDMKAIADLDRGLQRLGMDVWKDASQIAQRIGAEQAFAAGLRLLPAGCDLADKLALTREMTVELALRTWSVTQDALFFERFRRTPGARAKAALLLRKLFPTPATMRVNSSLARRGSLGLMCAWAIHPFALAWRLGPAFIAWYRARRATRIGPLPQPVLPSPGAIPATPRRRPLRFPTQLLRLGAMRKTPAQAVPQAPLERPTSVEVDTLRSRLLNREHLRKLGLRRTVEDSWRPPDTLDVYGKVIRRRQRPPSR